VLRRIANHLYRMGRDLERAEWRARLVDVNYHLLIESPPRAGEPWAPLVAITAEHDAFFKRYETLDEASVLDFVVFDTENPTSIRSSILSARERARALRHRISSELWLELNTFYLEAQQWRPEDLRARGVFEFFNDLKDHFYRLTGVIHGTLPRDLGFDFVAVGRSLEAIENVARLIDVKYHHLLPSVGDVGGPVDLLQWAAVLRSASALEAYRRSHGNVVRVERVVEMLLFDATFPRSARFGVEQLAAALGRIGGGMASAPPDTARALATALAESSATGILAAGLHDYLLAMEETVAGIGEGIVEQYLQYE